MRTTEEMFRGNFKCSRCGGANIHIIANVPDDNKYEAVCWRCTETAHKAGEKLKDLAVAYPCGIHVTWELVTKVRLHKLDMNVHDRRGTIVTLTMKEIPNVELAAAECVQALQFLMFFGSQYGIHKLGDEGEQNHTWVNVESWEKPIVGHITHKYIGEDEIECIRDSARILARRWKWELQDDTLSTLDQLAKVL